MVERKPILYRDGELLVREVAWDDCRNLYDWRMNEEHRPMFRQTSAVSYAEHEAFLKRYLADPGRDAWLLFEANGIPVGTIAVHKFSEDGLACECGRLAIDPAHKRKGYARRGMSIALEHAKSVGVQCVHVAVVEHNLPSLYLTYTLGFTEEGRKVEDGRTYILLMKELP